ncbi:MAG TPA: SRPBCC family protein [Jatrophihabitantaceae bacterium]|nr:SRPBCC family protein [Jatrophihabitantaceae bacterium]
MRGSVTVHFDTDARTVWNLVSDITRIGEFSPETFEAHWLGGATGPAVGARFRGHVRRNEMGPTYWTTCRVRYCEPERDFGFDVLIHDRPTNTWRYRLAPSGSGTDVTESFQLAHNPLLRVYWTLLGPFRGKRNVNDMRRTLERMKAVAEKDAQE